MTARLRAAIVALAAALACGLLGSSVSEQPPGALDQAGRALLGQWPDAALAFTTSGRWFVLVPLGVAAIALALAAPAWRARVTFSIATTIAAWLGSDALKLLFGRSRPPYWILQHETSASYPSGHAMFAVVVFGLWSYYIATSDLPQPLRAALSATVALWAAGVIWSRLALGAHYVTDLIGGVLFGITMLAVAASIAGGVPQVRSLARRSSGDFT